MYKLKTTFHTHHALEFEPDLVGTKVRLSVKVSQTQSSQSIIGTIVHPWKSKYIVHNNGSWCITDSKDTVITPKEQQQQWHIVVARGAGIPFAHFSSYQHSFLGGVCSVLWGQAQNLVVLASWGGRHVKGYYYVSCFLLWRLTRASIHRQGLLHGPSLIPSSSPTCQWISNYQPSWGRIFGWLFLMWQQQVRWSGSGPRLWSVTVPEEKGNLNWCWGALQHLCLFFTWAQGSLSLLTLRAGSVRAAFGLHSITHCNIWWANTLGESELLCNQSCSSVIRSATFWSPL